MKIAITGGTGFVGRTLARRLAGAGHEVVLVSRGEDRSDLTIRALPGAEFFPVGIGSAEELARAFSGCAAVAHCAGINREIGAQTYENAHVRGTQNVVEASRRAGVKKILLMSFLRARPNCGSAYHESKWQAEETVRGSGLDYTVLKCGVIYGKGDHMLDHLSHALHTFPVFLFVGFRDQPVRPMAVEDVARVMEAALVGGALARRTVAVAGPEEMTLREAVRRVATAVGKTPLMFPAPVACHYALGWVLERLMEKPLVSTAQVRMLAEGIAEAAPPAEILPASLAPQTRFTEESIRRRLPPPGPFRLRDLRWPKAEAPRRHSAFLGLP